MNYIIDFDSTLVTVEGLEELAKICGADVEKISEITSLGMEGKIGFDESLKRRLEMIDPNRTQLKVLREKMPEYISPSAINCKRFFQKSIVYVVSGGFEEWILPVTDLLGINRDCVKANKFRFDDSGNYLGIEERDLVLRDGKTREVKKLNLKGKTVVIGDGYTDYQIKEAGLVNEFWVYTETVFRENVTKLADREIKSFFDLV